LNDTAPTVPAAPPVPPISPLEAVTGTFSKPSETFSRLLARPTWWLPLAVSTVLLAALIAISMQKIDMERTVREAIEKRGARTGQSVPPEMVTRQVEATRKMQPVFLGVGVVFGVAAFFLIGLVLWGAARAMGAEARYGQMLAIWAHASLPNIIGALVAIPLFVTLADGSITQAAAQNVVASNVGAFLPETAPAALRSLLSSLDVFSLATLALLVLGFRRVPGLSRGAATSTPVVLWGLWVIGKTIWAALFG